MLVIHLGKRNILGDRRDTSCWLFFFVVVVVYVLLMLLSNFHISISSGYLHPHSPVDSIKDVVQIFFIIILKKEEKQRIPRKTASFNLADDTQLYTAQFIGF